MMDAIESFFTSDEAKRWIYHPLMQTAPPHTLHQYKRRMPAATTAFYDSGESP
jgi:hypothetical protein